MGTLNRVARATNGSTTIDPTRIAAPSAAPSGLLTDPVTELARQTAVAATAVPRSTSDRPSGLHSSARSSAVWTKLAGRPEDRYQHPQRRPWRAAEREHDTDEGQQHDEAVEHDINDPPRCR